MFLDGANIKECDSTCSVTFLRKKKRYIVDENQDQKLLKRKRANIFQIVRGNGKTIFILGKTISILFMYLKISIFAHTNAAVKAENMGLH